jgi:hypothetical protein
MVTESSSATTSALDTAGDGWFVAFVILRLLLDHGGLCKNGQRRAFCWADTTAGLIAARWKHTVYAFDHRLMVSDRRLVVNLDAYGNAHFCTHLFHHATSSFCRILAHLAQVAARSFQ